MAAEIQPAWLTSDLTFADARKEVQDLLARYQVLFRKLQVPGAVEASDKINKLLNAFSKAQLEALPTLFYSLERALFQSASTISDGREGRQRYLIEYVPPKSLNDFSNYVRTNLSDGVKVPFPGPDAVIAFLVEWINSLRGVIGTSPTGMKLAGVDDHLIADTPSEATALKQWGVQLGEALTVFQKILDDDAAHRSAINSAIEAQQAAVAARRAAGEAGALTMGQHFKQIADEETKSEANWNRILFGLIAVILGMSWFIVYKSAYTEWVQTLLHLIIILPVIGAATYASKNAGHHRVVGRWARTSSVQVNSVQAFSEQLSSPENRDKLILELGRNVFAAPAYGDPAKIEHFSAVPADIVEAVKEIAAKSIPSKE